LIKAYCFLLNHPKFEIEFPTDGSKPLSKHPHYIHKSQVNLDAKEDLIHETSNTFVGMPSGSICPTWREHSNRVDAINFIIDGVAEKASA
jgi:hypothetical protein